MLSSEIFAALFELELNGKIRQLPGKNFVKSLSWSVISCQSSAKSGGGVENFIRRAKRFLGKKCTKLSSLMQEVKAVN